MKFEGGSPAGEFGAAALYRLIPKDVPVGGWLLTKKYYLSREEAEAELMPRDVETGKPVEDVVEIKWPVQVWEDGMVYIPDPSELQ